MTSLCLLAFVVYSITLIDTDRISKNNLTSVSTVWSSILSVIGLGDESDISSCNIDDITLTCPSDALPGCYCNGGVLGDNNIIWQSEINESFFSFNDAKNYCSSLGSDWSIPSVSDLFTIYSYNIKLINTNTQPIKKDWFKSTSTVFWSNYLLDNGKNTVMLLPYNMVYDTSNSNVVCVKTVPTEIISKILYWQTPSTDIKLNFYDAIDYCNNLIYDGISDWRLPTKEELVDTVCSGDTSGFKTYYNYVTQTSHESYDNLAYSINITPGWCGDKAYSFFTKTNPYAMVRCVSEKTPVAVLKTESEILDLAISAVDNFNVQIDSDKNTIRIGLPYGTPVDSLIIGLDLSPGAVIDSGFIEDQNIDQHFYSTQNLTTPKVWKVTAENGSSQTYTVSVAFPPTVSLDISSPIILEKKTTNITWTPIGASSCVATGNDSAWPGSLNAVNGAHTWTTGQLVVDNMRNIKEYSYSISCSNDAGTTDTITKIVKVIPDYYPANPNQVPIAGGSARMSDALRVAGVTLGENEMMTLLYRDSYYYYTNQSQIAHITNCPNGTNYRVCVQDYNDGAYNHVLIGVGEINN